MLYIVFLGKRFQKKANACLFAEPRRSPWISSIHNWMEQSVYARLHLLNEGRLYKIDQTKININEMQLYYITRWHRCSILTPRVINKVHIGPQFEYIITSILVFPKHFFTARITHSNSSKVNEQWVIQVTAAERMRGRDEAAHIVHL